MYDKLVLNDDLTKIYRNHTALSEIQQAYDDGVAAGKPPADIEADMTAVITRQVAGGTYISRHLRAGAVDIRVRDMTMAQREAFKQAVKTDGSFAYPPLYEGKPPHWHLQLNMTPPSTRRR